jgi:hypothetical protein
MKTLGRRPGCLSPGLGNAVSRAQRGQEKVSGDATNVM